MRGPQHMGKRYQLASSMRTDANDRQVEHGHDNICEA